MIRARLTHDQWKAASRLTDLRDYTAACWLAMIVPEKVETRFAEVTLAVRGTGATEEGARAWLRGQIGSFTEVPAKPNA